MVSTYGLLPCGSALIVATLLIGQSFSCPTNCMNCSNNRTCGRCKDGYYNGHWYDDYQRYPELKNCSLPCHEDCKACTSYKNCTKCKLGFCIDHEERACKTSCNVKHCELCTSCDVCTKCNIWYYGKNCEEICAYGCKDQHCDITNGFCTCRQNFQGDNCDQCISGKYGKNCDKTCAKNCKTNMCDMQSGACVTGCKPGFKAPFCDSCIDGFFRNGGDICEKCPNACLRCTDSNNCLECEPRSWGHKCQHSCPSTCKSCDILGRCKECIQGYYGPSCTDTCQEGCEGNICSKNNGHCPTCKPGYSGYRCSTCEVGFWGQYCNTPCSRGCFEDKCTKDTGLCTNGCKPQFTGHTCGSCEKGYHGEECSPCPRNCEICTSDTLCSMCKAGYWGSRCENNCLDNCKECVSNNECSHCKKGFYGAKCSILCSQNCLDQACNKITGSCTKCTIGYYGERCEARCPETCAINYCNSDGNCFACAEGYFGVNCSSKCPSNCKGKCQLDGHCRSCIEGYFGNICNKNCPKNCLSCISGTNCKYCKPGFRGNICEHECSNCKPGTKCGQQDGHCEEDCADGLYGPMCGQPCLKECKTCARNLSFKCSSCIHGKYGAYDISGKTDYLTCKLNCSQACLNSSCNEENGQCLQGCVQGFWGALCNSLCPTNCKNGKCLDKEGACAEDCEEGYFGMKCMWACSDYERNCSTCLTDNYGLYNGCIMCKKGHFPTNNPSNRLKYKRCGPCSSNCSRNNCNTTNGFCEYGCKFGLWGSQCEKTCDYNCVGCEQFNGACLNCTDGRHGIKCLENCSLNCGRKNGVPVCSQYDGQCLNECTHGFHGQFCDMPCSKNCANNTCNKLDGDCSLGCLPGFDGKTCTRVTSGTSRGVIIATCCALVIGFLIFITVVICFKVHSRKRNKSSLEMREQHGHYMNDANQCDVKSRSDMVPGRRREHGNVDDNDVETRIEYANTSNTELFQTIENVYEVVEIESYEEENFKRAESTQTTRFTHTDEGTYYNTAVVLTSRVPIDKLQEFVSKKTKDDFINEFKEFPVGLIKSYKASQTTENFRKNRYRGLYPYDKRRVVIKEGKEDYINASYIDGHKRKNAYIACMGPTTKHMGADFAVFWEMIWQENVDIIVMLTNLKELGELKCDKYWPDRGSQKMCGDVKVTCIAEDISTDYTIRTITIQKREQKRRVFQMHFTSFPDKGIPQNVQSFTEFQNSVNNLDIVGSGPIVVHCSTGTGSTGTYIALDILTKEGRSENYVDLFACARNMREDRVNMIQTADQYIFLHESLVHVLTG